MYCLTPFNSPLKRNKMAEQTKTSIAIQRLVAGDLRGALAIFKTFRIGFTTDERRTLEIASECLNGHAGFYISLGINPNEEIAKSRAILSHKYPQGMEQILGDDTIHLSKNGTKRAVKG